MVRQVITDAADASADTVRMSRPKPLPVVPTPTFDQETGTVHQQAVPKVKGWTQSELVEVANDDGVSGSDSTFRRIREAAGISRQNLVGKGNSVVTREVSCDS